MNVKSWVIVAICFFVLCGDLSAQNKKASSSLAGTTKFTIAGPAQGTSYHISYFDKEETISRSEIDSILQVIDLSMSIYNPKSTISLFNQSNGEAVKLDRHFQQVMKASFYYYHLTKGIFDITVAPLVQLWGFGPQKINHFPDSNEISKAMAYVGMDKLQWNSPFLKKKYPQVHLDVNGIAQGYSVDVLADFFDKRKVKNYVIELGGEMRVKGRNGEGNAFRIGIDRPISTNSTDLKRDIIHLKSGAITTAGNFEKFMMHAGQKISHHVNPLTGYMFPSQIVSVTVYAKTAMEADALDNYFMALSPDEILNFVKKNKKLEVYIIFINKNGNIEEKFSNGFSSFFKI